MAEDYDADALLVPNPITTLGHILIAIRNEKFAEPIVELMNALDRDVLNHLTLFHVTETEDGVNAGEKLLTDVRRKLIDEGFSQASIDTEVVVSDDAPFAISEAARNDDLIVMGETQEPEFEQVFGKTYESIAEETDHPVLVVREH